ncbi:aldo/keto reductase [Pleomorphovibrio marinus]|uniref:aldo/keto reductase n=1 Tax=Pleomorphovibrio marinus TaxID=2164132 RepID=UPI001E366FF0|nr:aldo/keto reductase [Pleomorphovibrio marinus]
MRESRRKWLRMAGLTGIGIAGYGLTFSQSRENRPISKKSNIPKTNLKERQIPSSGENLPVVGLGTWITFDVGSAAKDRDPLREVLGQMYQKGGKVIDSSPMYGKSESVVGELSQEMEYPDHFFYATKVWTSGREAGIRQMRESLQKMNRKRMDLMQVHNLVDYKTHLKTLEAWKKEGHIRYIGVTHYTASSHPQLEQIVTANLVDFIQVNYSMVDRNAEKRLLPAAKDHGVAVIINRPYSQGSLFGKVKNKQLPEWCEEFGIQSWGQFFLKYLLGNEAVTCVIPGTSNPRHLVDNMGAGVGKMPDEVTRKKMLKIIEA